MDGFKQQITDLAELRSLIPPPDAPAVHKEVARLDAHCKSFIERSPFVVLASAGADGRCDASPRGGAPGFVAVLDEQRLAMADYPGNRRLDSWANVLANPHVQLLFFIPGLTETLRVSGRACLTRDPEVLARLDDHGKPAKLALGVEVETAFLQCGKSLRRSQLWDPATWPAAASLPSAARIFADHVALPGITEEAATAHLSHDYAHNLWPQKD
jgi:PPOX class probable FMN-dependent enzyme